MPKKIGVLGLCRRMQVPSCNSKEYKWYLLLCGLGFFAIGITVMRVYFRSDQFGIWDFPFIFDFANTFVNEGHLYSPDPTLYKPSVPTGYPHPPLSPALLVSAIRMGFSRNEIFVFLSFGHVICYFFSVACCWFVLGKGFSWRSFFGVFFVSFFMSQLMEDNLMALLLEPCLLFLICISMAFLSIRMDFFSGLFMGFAAMLKIYPAIFFIYFLLTGRKFSVFGMVISGIFCLIFSVFVMGFHENFIYFSVALPQQLREYPYLFFYANTSLQSYMLYFDIFSPGQAKVFGSLVFVILLFFSLVPSAKQKSFVKNSGVVVALDYACLTSLLVLCMPNSWWNYQIHLLVSAIVVAGLMAGQPVVRPFLSFSLIFSVVVLAVTAAMAIDHDVGYFIQMDNYTRMTYIVLRGLPNFILFALPFFIRWQIYLGRGGWIIEGESIPSQPGLQPIS